MVSATNVVTCSSDLPWGSERRCRRGQNLSPFVSSRAHRVCLELVSQLGAIFPSEFAPRMRGGSQPHCDFSASARPDRREPERRRNRKGERTPSSQECSEDCHQDQGCHKPAFEAHTSFVNIVAARLFICAPLAHQHHGSRRPVHVRASPSATS